MIRIISWNIQQGGGSRVDEIVEVLVGSGAQILCLNEFKNNDAGARIRSKLLKAGFFHQFVGLADSNTNTVLSASSIPFDASHFSKKEKDFPQAIVRADFEAFSLFNMYLPHKKKHDLFDIVLEEMKINPQGIFVGDYNSGKQFIDQKGDSFWYSEYFERMENADYIDAWRFKNGDEKEYSWYSHQGNGFRYDHTYTHENLTGIISNCYYEHSWRLRKLSDHSPMILELG